MAKGFAEDEILIDLEVNAAPFAPSDEGIEDLYDALVLGMRDYFVKQGFTKAVLGLSGGIDSAVVACLANEALGRKTCSSLEPSLALFIA